MEKFVKWANEGARLFLITVLSITAVVSVAQVLGRFVVGQSIFWSEEFCRYSLVWMTLIGTILLVKEKKMITMSFVLDRLPPNLISVLNPFLTIMVDIFLLIVVYAGIKLTLMTRTQISVSTGIPMVYIYMIIPIAFFFMALNSIYSTIQELRKCLS